MLRISVIICSRDRPKALSKLLKTLLNQTYPPLEIILVDDSSSSKVKDIVDSFRQRFDDSELRYIKGCGDGLPAARNLGVKASRGDAILFLDDDTLLQKDVLDAFATFLSTHPTAVGVQGQIYNASTQSSSAIRKKIANAVRKVFLLFYYEQDKLTVRRSGTSIFPYSYPMTSTINAQRLDGCCMCYRAELLEELRFDTNLKGWAFMEDLDFSYRVYKRSIGTLHAIPSAIITHRKSTKSRLPSREHTYMTTIYWFYVFFKDVLEGSILNLVAFLWALAGNFMTVVGGLLIERRSEPAWWNLIYLLHSYAVAFTNLKAVKSGELGFFNKSLDG